MWTASTATNLGDGMRLVAMPLLATDVATNVLQIALVTVPRSNGERARSQERIGDGNLS